MEADNIDGKKEPKRLPVWACISLFIVVLFIFIGLYGTLVSGGLSLVLGVEARHPGVVGYIFVEASMLLAVLTAAVILLRLERRPFSDLGLSLKGHASGLWYGLLMAILLYLLGFGISVVVCSCWRVLLLLVSFNALQRTGECATAISSKEYPSRRITRLASLRNTCESLSLAVEPRCSTFVGKHSAIFTDSLRKSAFFSSLFVFSSISCCVSENYNYLCIGSFLVRGLDPEFRQS